MKTCQALTKSETQCLRSVKQGQKYCWQHQLLMAEKSLNDGQKLGKNEHKRSGSNVEQIGKWLAQAVGAGVIGNAIYDVIKSTIYNRKNLLIDFSRSPITSSGLEIDGPCADKDFLNVVHPLSLFRVKRIQVLRRKSKARA